MNNKHVFLSYNVWDGEYHKGYSIDHKNLNPSQIESAIDLYIVNQNELKQENERLKALLDEIMVENVKYKKYYDIYLENSKGS